MVMTRKLALLLILSLVLAACSAIGSPGAISNLVPTTGDTASDPSAAQRFLPNIPGYTATDTTSISSAIAAVGGGASLLSGNPATAAMVAQIDGMIQCYQNVGAVAARVYTQTDISGIVQGQIPNVGALAVINQDRLINNFLACALGSGQRAFSAQAVEPCGGSGSTVVDGETLHYVYAATTPDLCTIFASQFPPMPQ